MSNVERAYYDDGALRAKGNIVDGLPHGLHREWHPNGVLAKETPYDHGVIDGVVKQWDDKGELVAESILTKGTGVLRTIDVMQGCDGEITYVDGKWTGRQLVYCAGDLMEVIYWLDNNRVSKQRYLEASKENPNLPQYEDNRRLGPTWPQKMEGAKPKHTKVPENPDELPLKLLQGPRVREALAWLQESRQPSRSLGEATSQVESIRLVKELYSLGAVAVRAVEIEGRADDNQNTGRIVIELPRDQQRRKNLLEFCGDIAREAGFDPETELGQRYVLLMLD